MTIRIVHSLFLAVLFPSRFFLFFFRRCCSIVKHMPKTSDMNMKECHDCGHHGNTRTHIVTLSSYFIVEQVPNGARSIMVFFFVMNVVVYI
jgi:hypothetical protein